MDNVLKSLAERIDAALINPDVSETEIDGLLAEAKEQVNPYVMDAAEAFARYGTAESAVEKQEVVDGLQPNQAKIFLAILTAMLPSVKRAAPAWYYIEFVNFGMALSERALKDELVEQITGFGL